ncbi:coagulation factor VII-like [Protopterus annectens]|uniref:coagulation factor VII-like n=1 Tax=Protopterus annectens TaxID=7888 RepID=UPI001CFAE77B|nr:coagulation factor VII-like [Protopterus annectens]
MVFFHFAVQFFCSFVLFSDSFAAVFLERHEASNVLKREKRANSWFEELYPGSLERECIEEKCSFEEAREIFKDYGRTMDFWRSYTDRGKCQSNPCQNGGTCSDNFQNYVCLCPEGFEGRNCEFDLNLSLKCEYDNGGCEHFCHEIENLVRECSCVNGYRLGNDQTSCIPEVPYPCGRFQVLNETKNQTSVETQAAREGRIVGGTECPKGECPWQALLTYKGAPFCGGILVSPKWVITAAHCLVQKDKKNLHVILGEHNVNTLDGSEVTSKVVDYILHEKYVKATSDNDIALLRLQKAVNYTQFIVPICLPEVQFAVKVLSSVKLSTVSGWGRLTENGPTAAILQRVEIQRVKTQECIEISKMNVTENMFCAGFKEGKQDSCKGDSGGPHASKYKNTWFLTGVVSFGEGCARQNKYGIYSRLSKFINWLDQKWVLQWMFQPLKWYAMRSQMAEMQSLHQKMARKKWTPQVMDAAVEGVPVTGVVCNEVTDPKAQCSFENGGCDHYCKMKSNSVECSCVAGYELGADKKSCIPIAETFACGRLVAGTSPTIIPETDQGNINIHKDTFSKGYSDDIKKIKQNPSSHTEAVGNPHSGIHREYCPVGHCPWQATFLNKENSTICEGVILNEKFILTAAHCFIPEQSIRVVVGDYDREKIEGTEYEHQAEQWITHQSFTDETYNYDIALVKLTYPISFTPHVIPVCLPDKEFSENILMKQQSGLTGGFCDIPKSGEKGNKLMQLAVPFIDQNKCITSSNFSVTQQMFCAGYENETHIFCHGGSPHITAYKNTYFITGVLIQGGGGAIHAKYNIYTKVSAHLAWINTIMKFM